MKSTSTTGIILSRTNFGEADRIITFLTPDHGKVSVMAKGVRKSRAKLAGSVELFSVSDISYITGRGGVGTLISARLIKYYGSIVKDIQRTNAAYDFLKMLNKATEDNTEPGYFKTLNEALAALNEAKVSLPLARAWFAAQLLKLAGHSPNLITDKEGYKLEANKKYDFDFERMCFGAANGGAKVFTASDIKFLRLLFSGNPPRTLQKVRGVEELAASTWPLTQSMLSAHIRV